MATPPLNTSSDDAAFFQANSSDDTNDIDDGEDPTGGKAGAKRASGTFMYKRPQPKKPLRRKVVNMGKGPSERMNLTPGAHHDPWLDNGSIA